MSLNTILEISGFFMMAIAFLFRIFRKREMGILLAFVGAFTMLSVPVRFLSGAQKPHLLFTLASVMLPVLMFTTVYLTDKKDR